MKKIKTDILSGLILVGFVLSSIFTAQAAVTITVTGRVVATPCTVSTTNATVELGDLNTLSLASAGSASPWHNVELDLNNCPVGISRVTARVSGTADSTGYYKNQGTAGGIQLELQDNSGNRLNTGATKSVQVDDATQSARFLLQVRALSVNGGATQGTIQAVINVTYTYS
ncbi:fimbrial protein [Aeromonas bestiarum]|uniref:fimbrial protein n=1 Tax=Aeromonas bestiarum TaxID=105751 RepID=UPI003D228424